MSAPKLGARPTPPSPIAWLRTLGARSREAVSDSYARAARSVLQELERLDDTRAERRYRSRERQASARPNTLPTAE